ncbi:hypothetical protein Lepto7376_1557 [[Leptolyngbya] sp. PCC 7376]|uniref:hypothetical protein n=1 Tax=[Leptolyngbya] sp. PCC 7376 TaxID=111781 RepID=UPI00029F4900|nr:hypothetical protein [[Leptolyngbya] sp. PCC 7376]AFY37897.1 hypothetical protein Lepto7376_1557 [[Leptolyngbya] sp. PCC 7376]
MRNPHHGVKALSIPIQNSGFVTVHSYSFIRQDILDLIHQNKEAFLTHIIELNKLLNDFEKVTIVESDSQMDILFLSNFCQKYDCVSFGSFLSYFDNRKSQTDEIIGDFLDSLKKTRS